MFPKHFILTAPCSVSHTTPALHAFLPHGKLIYLNTPHPQARNRQSIHTGQLNKWMSFECEMVACPTKFLLTFESVTGLGNHCMNNLRFPLKKI